MSGTITVVRAVADYTAIADGSNKQEIFKSYDPFNDYITEINNTHLNNAKDLDLVMPMYNLI